MNIREHANNYINFPFGDFLWFVLTDFYQKILFLQRSRHSYLFRHLSSCGAVNPSEKVNEVVPFPLPFLFGSCLNAHASPNEHWPFVIQRLQSLFQNCFGIVFAFSFCFPFARSSHCRSVLVAISRFEMRILDVLLGVSFGPLTSICNNHISCRRMPSLRLATTLPTFSTCILHRISNMLSVGLSLTAENPSSHFVSKA